MPNHFSVTIEREDAPAVVVTVRRPTEEEAVAYWQHRQDAEDPKRAAHGGHADSAADIMAACVTSVSPAAVKATKTAPPEGQPEGPSAADQGEEYTPFVPTAGPRAAAGGEGGDDDSDPVLSGDSAADRFLALREEYPHLPRQLHSRFMGLAGDNLVIASVPVPESARGKGRRLRAVMVDAKVRKDKAGKTAKGPDGKPVFDGKLVVLSRLTATDVEFMDAESATLERKVPTGAQFAAQARAHLVECPAGLLQEYPLLAVYLGQMLYGAAAAKIGGAQGE
jgi:hypothetical protein